jgi:transposase
MRFFKLIYEDTELMKLTQPKIKKRDWEFIKARRNKDNNLKLRTRLNILFFTKKFDNANLIAELAGVSTGQVFKIIKIYNNLGIDGIKTIKHNKQKSKLMGFAELICREFKDKAPSSIKEARIIIYQLTGIRRSLTQVRKFLKKLGMKYLKPLLIPTGKNETDLSKKVKAQKEFVKNKLSKAMKDAKKGKCKLLFMDSSHMQLSCMLGFIWCFIRPCLPALPLRGRVNVIGAISFYGDNFIYDINQTTVDQDAIIKFLKKIRTKSGNQRVTIVLDNASYHHANRVEEIAESLNISLLFLPVASPNLNIIERLWKLIKSKFLKNRIFMSLDELENSLLNNLKTLKKKHKKDLASLLTPKFQYFDDTMQFQTV